MAARFDSFGLEELAARPEDALRLCSLAMTQGQRVRGYRGDYYRLYLGDAIVNARTMTDPETGEEELLGMDTHAVSGCVWESEAWELCPQEIEGERPMEEPADGGPGAFRGDPLQRWVLLGGSGGDPTLPVYVVNADALTWEDRREPLRLNMAAFPRWVEYFSPEEDRAAQGGEAGAPPAEQGEVLLRGVVKDAKVGETYMGMEPMTKFLSVTVSTRFGDVELCHPFELVAEERKDNVRPGALVSTLCTLSGDAAVGAYAAGVVFSEEKDLELLAYFFRRGGAQRLRGVTRSDGAVTFLANRQEGIEGALALLETVGQRLWEAGLRACAPGTVTAVEGDGPAPCLPGKRCLLLGDGERYAFLCLVDTDSVGRVREILITNDSRLNWELD